MFRGCVQYKHGFGERAWDEGSGEVIVDRVDGFCGRGLKSCGSRRQYIFRGPGSERQPVALLLFFFFVCRSFEFRLDHWVCVRAHIYDVRYTCIQAEPPDC